ncbi:hypothetical protein TNCV_3690001 [Trichonephila clavipes]|uniref:Uncharacterized protein n=1 Tax=Trichonephila clavipes TaxID=2585209 RepID=A0A8X6VFS2_TRICX|nr:hypothetical protein TNCV_3690001 [Trichonephila clavipes]
MARRNHLDNFTRGKMMEKLKKERSLTSGAKEFGINKSVISRAWKASQTINTAVRNVDSDLLGNNFSGCLMYSTAGEKSPVPASKRHCSATLYNGKCHGLL